jgi:hypothetical protein
MCVTAQIQQYIGFPGTEPPHLRRLPLSHGGNTGSNPVGDAIDVNKIERI